MSTQTVSTRLDAEEAARLDELARATGLDRATLLQQIIRRGYAEVQLERALRDYRKGQVTLSRAAEMAGLSLREMLLQLPGEGVELNYDLREFQRDLAGS
jgi:predicted HTH domain antitoxin